ncbi:MAG: DUF167 family protein [Verrucomicrobia bacterium]|nr:DUF167 family protein [Verrucomicrobiota bacterium]
MSFLKQTTDGCRLAIRVQPGASRSEVAGLHGAELKVRVKAPPVEGKANEALLECLAKLFRVKRNQCELLRGKSTRSKTVFVRGLNEALARAELAGRIGSLKPPAGSRDEEKE